MKTKRLTEVLGMVAAMLLTSLPCAADKSEYVTDNPIVKGDYIYEIVEWDGEPEARLMEIAPDKEDKMVDAVVPATIEYEGTVYPVRYLESNVFYNLTELKTVTLPVTLKHITSNFIQCPKLERVVFPEGMNATCYSIFHDCPSLTSIDLPSTIEYVGHLFLNSCGIKSLVFDRPIGFGMSCVCDMPNLEELIFNDFVDISEGCFQSLPKLKQIDLTATNLDCIWPRVFYECPHLEEIILPTGDELIIFDNAFLHCPSLKKVFCPNAIPPYIRKADASTDQNPVEFGGFTGKKGSIDKETCTLFVPVGAVEAYRADPRWNAFKNIVEYDFTSTEAIEREMAATPGGAAEYFDLCGRRVSSPTKGIYIIRNGEIIRKAVIR